MIYWQIFLLAFILLPYTETKKEKLIIKSKSITVKGETTIGGFSCVYSLNGLQDTLVLQSNEKIGFEISVKEFSCGNFLVNRDLRQTLKAEEFPKASVEAGDFSANSTHLECTIDLDIVGKKVKFNKVRLVETKKGLEAEMEMSFEELELEPPSKFGGLVEVEDKLSIRLVLGL
jgi:hypothetical protein